MHRSFRMLLGIGVLAALGAAQEFSTVEIKSGKDQVMQKALWWAPDAAKAKAVPLVVALHSWSGGYDQKESLDYLKHASDRGWAVIHPDFRGYNKTPLSCGSDTAVTDVMDAVRWAKAHAKIDARQVYLVGVSGGGYMSLLMASRHPKAWKAVSAWVPISDLAVWYSETKARGLHYSGDMEAVFGGPPGIDAKRDAEYKHRSPLFAIRAAKGVPMDINTGVHDGHTGSVPVSQTLRAFNELAIANGFPGSQIGEEDIRAIVDTEKIPAKLGPAPVDEAYKKPVLLRREAGPARVTVFEGTHEMLMDAAFAFLDKHR